MNLQFSVQIPKDIYISLITCTPYAINTHRLLVSAERVDFSEDAYDHAIATGNSNTNLWWVLELVVGLGAITGLAIWMWPKSGKHFNQPQHTEKKICSTCSTFGITPF